MNADMMDSGSGMGSGGLWLFALVILIAAVVVVLGVRFRSARARTLPPADDAGAPRLEARNAARKLLDARYARGELGSDEYRERVITLDQEG